MMPASRRSLRVLVVTLWRLRLARLCSWLARASDRYSGPHMRLARRMVEAAERVIYQS
jgi:hypothetical protein